jgi:hypothetical protein
MIGRGLQRVDRSRAGVLHGRQRRWPAGIIAPRPDRRPVEEAVRVHPPASRPSYRSHPGAVLATLLVLGGMGVARGQAPASTPSPPADAGPTVPAIEPSEAVVRIEGVAENRFNPTHGTMFFKLSGADFPVKAEDVAVLINEAPVPASRVAISRRIVSASYVMPPGLNDIVLRAWDPLGRLISADALLWAGDRLLVIDVVDVAGLPVEGAEVTARLANQRSVQDTVRAAGGVAQFVNLPSESIAVEASHPDGRSGSLAVPPDQQRAVLTLR